MKIMVIGGAGFIGSNIVDTYVENGHEVVVVDNLSSGKLSNINKNARFYNKDIRNKDIINIIKSERPDVINHHAAQKSVPASVKNPTLDAEINILGLLNILNASIQAEVKKIIFASSGGALSGDNSIIPTSEVTVPILMSPYSITKFMGEKYIQYFSDAYGISYTILRYANVYGKRQTSDGECGVIPIFIENIINGRPSYLFTYHDMPGGTTRDYVYVSDVSSVNNIVLNKGDNQIYNIGLGTEIGVATIYELLQELTNTNLPLVRRDERAGDIRRSSLCPKKANKQLGWEPKIDLYEGLKITLSHYFALHK
ncbi:NAD-dependent epimerase/dehydratase [Paenibacillus thiaminolyticus]|nr:NAD-dependent epimerase/dehydratase [Paenibacillus thiaminolyticus]